MAQHLNISKNLNHPKSPTPNLKEDSRMTTNKTQGNAVQKNVKKEKKNQFFGDLKGNNKKKNKEDQNWMGSNKAEESDEWIELNK